MKRLSSRPRVVLVNRAIVLKDKKILLIQRSMDDEWCPGKWEFPGGKLDEGQDISNALEREVLEEAGLLIIPINRMAYYESKIMTSGKYATLPYIGLIGIAKAVGEDVKLSSEHQDYAWVDFVDALNHDITEETRKSLQALKSLLEDYLE